MNLERTIDLLKALIAIPSFSKEEKEVADFLESFLIENSLRPFRKENNLWVKGSHWKESNPTLLLNSHIDTVSPNQDWTVDPFVPLEVDGKIIGLGSNDAGGPLVSLIATFCQCNTLNLPFNLLLACTAEEEISGPRGIRYILEEIDPDFGIIGEPTSGKVAIAEKGLMVIDALAHGVSGHAARDEGVNAIYTALQDIHDLQNHPFRKESPWLGPLKISVTQIDAGTQHNVVPDKCHFVIDVRTTELYPNQVLFESLQAMTESDLKARSTRLNPSFIEPNHVLVKAASDLNLVQYGSPTLSDQALLSIPTIKMGPGDSARSHTANEYIYKHEIEAAIVLYKALISQLAKNI